MMLSTVFGQRALASALPRRLFSSLEGSAAATNRSLYRILQRQVDEIEHTLQQQQQQQQNNETSSCEPILLLHPPLDPHMMGQYKIIKSVYATGDKTDRGNNRNNENDMAAQSLLHLFCRWEEQATAELQIQRDMEGDEDNDTAHEHLLKLDQIRLVSMRTFLERVAPSEQLQVHFGLTAPELDSLNTLWTTPSCLKRAIRMAFAPSSQSPQLAQSTCVDWSLRAYRYLTEQLELCQLTTTQSTLIASSSTLTRNHVRVTCVAREVGRSLDKASAESKYRFVYRIRMENVGHTETSEAISNDNNMLGRDPVVQLLGRSWIIREDAETKDATTRAADDSSDGLDDNDASYNRQKPPLRVHAPRTGAVGSHAVLHKGKALEYMSGCDLSTSQGQMEGAFYFSTVPPDTPHGMVGQYIAALDDSQRAEEDEDAFDFVEFQAPVAPFPLRGRRRRPRRGNENRPRKEEQESEQQPSVGTPF